MIIATANIDQITQGMLRIRDALPVGRADAFAALAFMIAELAAEDGIPTREVHDTIDVAVSTRVEAVRRVMS